jgi:hypothetical protein
MYRTPAKTSNRFTAAMRRRTDTELVEVLHANEGEWVDEAVVAARLEVEVRAIPTDRIATLAEHSAKTKRQWAKAPTSDEGWRTFGISLILPGVGLLLGPYSWHQAKANGAPERARKILIATLAGAGAGSLLGALLRSLFALAGGRSSTAPISALSAPPSALTAFVHKFQRPAIARV